MKTALSAVAVAAALALAPFAGGAFAVADDSAQQQGRFTPEDRAAFLDARIAALKAGLELNAEQEKNWPPLESAMRDLAKQRAARFAAWRERREESDDETAEVNPIDRLTRASEFLSARAADLAEAGRAPPSRSTTASTTARSAGSPCFSMGPWVAAIGATGAARADGAPQPAGFALPLRTEPRVAFCHHIAAAASGRRWRGAAGLCHNRKLAAGQQGGIDGEGTDARQQRSQEAEVGQGEELRVRIQEVARRNRPSVAAARQEDVN